MTRKTAKVFMSGRSQAVRIPKAYRFPTSEVLVVRQQGGLLLVPHRTANWRDFFKSHTCPDFKLDRSFAQAGQARELFP